MSPPHPAPHPGARRPPKRTGVGCMAIPLLFFTAIGGVIWGYDALRLLRARPTPAVVTASSVAVVRGRSGATYSPRVTYRYVAAGRERVGTRAIAGSESRGRDWAEAIAERFPPGTRTRAWVLPDAPDDAFLVRRPSGGAFFFLAIPLVVLALFAMDGAPPAEPEPPEPAPDGAGRWTLAAAELPREAAEHRARQLRNRVALAAALLVPHLALAAWTAAGETGVLGPVRSLLGATVGDGFVVAIAAALAGLLWWADRRRRTAVAVAGRLRDVVLTLDRPRLRAGEHAEAVLAVDVDGAPRGVSLGIAHQGSNVHGRWARPGVSWRPLLGAGREGTPTEPPPPPGAELAPADAAGTDAGLVARCPVRLAASAAPSRAWVRGTAGSAWAFVVDVRLADGRTWEARFPVRVDAADGG